MVNFFGLVDGLGIKHIREKKDKGRNGTYAALQSTIWQIRSWNTTGIEKDGVIFSTQNDGIFK